MPAVPLLEPTEPERLQALRDYQILDTPPEEEFDDLARLASEICAAPIALVSLIDRDRQWFKSKVGLAASETPRNVAFCAHAILQDELFVVPDAQRDDRFADNPLVTGEPHVRFYAGAPLRGKGGLKLGTLCVIDHVSRDLTPFQQDALRVLGRQVEAQLELRLKLREIGEREVDLRSQRDALVRAERQKEALTVLVVHDLKGPLTSILPDARFLLDQERLSDDGKDAARAIVTSSESMHRMVLNLLDISRSEDGTLVPKLAEVDVRELLEEVHRELLQRAGQQRRAIELSVPPLELTVQADRDLLRRVLENLLDNSLKYSEGAGGAIHLDAALKDGDVELRVRDEGPGVPAAYREKILRSTSSSIATQPPMRAAAGGSASRSVAWPSMPRAAESGSRTTCHGAALSAFGCRRRDHDHSSAGAQPAVLMPAPSGPRGFRARSPFRR